MIRIFNSRTAKFNPGEIDAMFKLRKRVFHDFLKWDVSVRDEWEIDNYDTANPLYVLSYSDDGRLRGSLRLLPTLGPNMLDDTFPILLDGEPEIRSASIWESSRFSVDHEADIPIGPNGMSRAAAELGLAMNQIGMRLGLTHIVTVYDAIVHRTLRKARCAGEPIGPAKRVGGTLAYAVFYEVSAETERLTRAASGIYGPVLEDEMDVGPLLKVA